MAAKNNKKKEFCWLETSVGTANVCVLVSTGHAKKASHQIQPRCPFIANGGVDQLSESCYVIRHIPPMIGEYLTRPNWRQSVVNIQENLASGV